MTLSKVELGFIDHDALERILDAHPVLARALAY